MKISSHNEWSRLRAVVVGTAQQANWPGDDPVFQLEKERTLWKDSPLPKGAVPDWIVEETEQDLEGLVSILKSAGVTVVRPDAYDYQSTGGMYGYCPRDRLLIAGEIIVDVAMMYPCRDQEIFGLRSICDLQSTRDLRVMPRDQNLVCDAANICRLGDTWLFLESYSGNRAAGQWLADQFPHIEIYGCDFYAGVHIDSTVVPLREGLVMLNASRVNEQNCPVPLRSWDKIWITDEHIVPQDFYQYPWASKWIAMNTLSIDQHTVIVDADQNNIIRELEQRGITVVPHKLRHSRTLGGGFHCVTLDLWRQDD